MSDLDENNFNDTDSSDNEEQHIKFVNSVAQLDSTQRVKPALRTEISTEISEYNLQKPTSNSGLVNVKELANALKRKTKHAFITNKLKTVTTKSKTLPKPLEKAVEDKLKRIVGYENVQNQLKRWNAVVEKNALKQHLSFPLNNNTMKLETSSTFLKQFKKPTPLEEEIANVLNEKKQEENQIEDFPLTLEEMLEKKKEMARLRAQLSYKEAKAQRQNKIKSKKYHRILKHEKLRQQLKDFEILQKTDPTKALEKLSELDKNRALERASLRHRNTGQWAKNKTVRAKYDIESRKILAEQLKMSREITRKVFNQDSSDDEQTNTPGHKHDVNNSKSLIVAKDNPWSLDVSKEIKDFVCDYKKYWSEKNSMFIEEQGNTEPNKQINGISDINNKDESDNQINGTGIDQKDPVNIPKIEEASSGKLLEAKASNNLPVIKEIEKGKKRKKEKKQIALKRKINTAKSSGITEKNIDLKLETNSLVTVRPTSGLWVVTHVSDTPETPTMNKKRKVEGIDNIFNDLEEKLIKNADKKVKVLNSKLKKKEKLRKKTDTKQIKEVKLSTILRGDVTQRPDLDTGLIEGDEESYMPKDNTTDVVKESQTSTTEIDPKNFIQIKPKKLGTDLPNCLNTGDDAIDDAGFRESQQQIIEEAFGDDDVIAEFDDIKNKEGNTTELKISTALPGWGEWGGTGLVLSKRKRKRFTVVKLPPRKDKNKPDIIINEEENPNIRNHLVREIPHPFKSVEAFESNIRAPVGREWVPETAHQKLIQKPIETKLGTIIDPMTENEIINSVKPTVKSPYKGKKK